MAKPSQASKRGAGRPPFEPTDEQRRQTETLAGIGVPIKMIALIIGVSHTTLIKHLRYELDLGEARATAKVAQTLFAKAIKGDTTSLIFWLKARAGWSERDNGGDKFTGPLSVSTGVSRAN